MEHSFTKVLLFTIPKKRRFDAIVYKSIIVYNNTNVNTSVNECTTVNESTLVYKSKDVK